MDTRRGGRWLAFGTGIDVFAMATGCSNAMNAWAELAAERLAKFARGQGTS